MIDILQKFEPITLDQMKDIRLMNRTDTKFVTTEPMLRRILEMAQQDYYVQETDGKRLLPYETKYYDTPHCLMYYRHQFGRSTRQKVRIRTYVSSELQFLEVKNKDNHGRTRKNRIKVEGIYILLAEYKKFLKQYSDYNYKELKQQLKVEFDRITLVNKEKTERLTIDLNLAFTNFTTDQYRKMQPLVIIELKRDKRNPSPILPILRELHIRPRGFSKYCIGSALTNRELRINGMKLKLRKIKKLINRQNNQE